VNLRVGLLVGEVCAKPPSHAGYGTTKTTLVVAQCRCRGDDSRDVMLLSSIADDDTAKSTLTMV
jgi:hypothetical protein